MQTGEVGGMDERCCCTALHDLFLSLGREDLYEALPDESISVSSERRTGSDRPEWLFRIW